MLALRPISESRFWEKVAKNPDGGCWVWTASVNERGYGRFWIARLGVMKAHRFSWEMANGAIPRGLFVLHRCDVPACVRPDHLFLGTAKDNARDAIAKGRGWLGALNSQARLTEDVVRQIRDSDLSAREIAAAFGISVNHVSQLRLRKRWAHIA